jgi:hypothetical protein
VGIKDREDDNLEAEEVYHKEPVVPFNLEELNISMPRLKYDVDEFYLEILRDKYSQFEKCLEVCKQHDCYLESEKIIKKLL